MSVALYILHKRVATVILYMGCRIMCPKNFQHLCCKALIKNKITTVIPKYYMIIYAKFYLFKGVQDRCTSTARHRLSVVFVLGKIFACE